MARERDTVIVTGSSGFIGRALARRLSERFNVVGFDLKPAEDPCLSAFFSVDLSSEESISNALREARRRFGSHIASVVHLAAYFDLTGEPNPKYQEITVEGTRRLLSGLQSFALDQFIFASTMLVHRAGRPGEFIDESTPLERKLPYRDSKIDTEEIIHRERGRIPVVYLRPAGVYDDQCRNAFLSRQITRIYERSPKSYVYPGDLRTGQSFVHIDDLVEAVALLIERRKQQIGRAHV